MTEGEPELESDLVCPSQDGGLGRVRWALTVPILLCRPRYEFVGRILRGDGNRVK